ncbi:uncharacterized protein LOC143193633 [Rhynchophorus ferrugineus]|uniref:uncharacterized protein LOC143193633 n=1 Tax=Rhynchophorus ferrugineus TaxID=354439 RepID=UPI003FCDC856
MSINNDPDNKIDIIKSSPNSQGYIRIIRNNSNDEHSKNIESNRHGVPAASVSNTDRLAELKDTSGSPIVKFGWHTIESQHIPYIIVNNLKYVSVRIINERIFSTMNKFSPEVYQCLRVNCYPLSKYEASLFNEINFKHCDGSFGKLLFVEGRDRKILMEDFLQTYNFLKFCTRIMFVLINNIYNDIHEDSCGFLQINVDNFVPFVVRNGERYAPVFYFEGDYSQLKNKFIKATKWEMTYFQFLFRLQDLKKEFLQLNSCDIVNITDIRPYFNPQTTFVLMWPITDCAWMKIGNLMKANENTQ